MDPVPARVGIVVGSRSDIAAAEKAAAVLDELGVPSEIRVISAHRAPDLLARFASTADERGIRVFIAIAGLAAHLPGVLASQTTAPVIGVPMAGGVADGLDALLAVVQMPNGTPRRGNAGARGSGSACPPRRSPPIAGGCHRRGSGEHGVLSFGGSAARRLGGCPRAPDYSPQA